MWQKLYKMFHNVKTPVRACPQFLGWSLTLALQDSTPSLSPLRARLTPLTHTVIICEGEVAVLGAQGESEPHVCRRYVLVCCRDLYNQLECERWGTVSGGVGWPGVH